MRDTVSYYLFMNTDSLSSKSSISELDPVGDVINDSATETLARILVKGLSAAHSADDKLSISWSKG